MAANPKCGNVTADTKCGKVTANPKEVTYHLKVPHTALNATGKVPLSHEDVSRLEPCQDSPLQNKGGH